MRFVISRLGQTSAGADVSAPIAIPAIPETLPNGLHDLVADGGRSRVNVRALHTGERIAVAERSMIRDEIARDSASRTLFPMLALTSPTVVNVTVCGRLQDMHGMRGQMRRAFSSFGIVVLSLAHKQAFSLCSPASADFNFFPASDDGVSLRNSILY